MPCASPAGRGRQGWGRAGEVMREARAWCSRTEKGPVPWREKGSEEECGMVLGK